MAIQKLALDALKTQGAKLTDALSSAAPKGSINSGSQGTKFDAWA